MDQNPFDGERNKVARCSFAHPGSLANIVARQSKQTDLVENGGLAAVVGRTLAGGLSMRQGCPNTPPDLTGPSDELLFLVHAQRVMGIDSLGRPQKGISW